MSLRPRVVALVTALVLAPLSVPARAQSAGDLDRADQLYRKGNTAYDAEKWQDAYDTFGAAWALKKSFDIAGNLGDVELVLGKPRDAAEHLSYSLRHAPASMKAEVRDRTKQLLTEARAQVGTVVVRVNVNDAEIFVDGRLVGRSPLPGELFVDPGDRTLEAKFAGHPTSRQVVHAAKGIEVQAALFVESNGTTGSGMSGVGTPGIAAAGAAGKGSDAGTGGSGVPANGAQGGQALAARDSGETGSSKSWVPIAVGGGVAAVGVFVGVTTWILANGKNTDAQDRLAELNQKKADCGNPASDVAAICASLRAANSDRDAYRHWVLPSFLVGGAAAAATAAYVLWPVRASASQGSKSAFVSVRPSVAVSATDWNLAVSGTW